MGSVEVKAWTTGAVRRARHFMPLAVVLAVLLALSHSGSASPTRSNGKAIPTGTAWKTYTSDRLGVAIRYPTSWHVYIDTMHGRYSGFNPILLASFEMEFEEFGHGLGIPPGGAAVLVAFEGSDRAPDQDLADYGERCCGPPFYNLTDRKLRLGRYAAVELVGEAGHVYLLARGPNVYSLFTFAGNDSRWASVIGDMLSTLSPLRDAPLPMPKGARALAGAGGELLPLSKGPTGAAPAWAGPAMKMPWDQSASYRYTGGPHNWTMNWTCYLAPIEDACGLDFGLHYREVLASASGTVQWGYRPGTGNYAIIDHGDGWSTYYLHLSEIDGSLSWGQTVLQGRVLGISGTAGSGPHLHFEIRYNNLPTTWHGTAVDGYVARMFVNAADESRGWNYQGTLTRGTESKTMVTYCDAPTFKWMGSAGTITAGDGQPVASTNQRHTGEPSPTETPTPTSTSTPTLAPSPTSSPTSMPTPEPDVSIDKAVIGGDFRAGERITFTLAVANIGDKIASGAVVTDIIPPEVVAPTFVSTLALTPTGALPYVWDVEKLETGGGGAITITGWIGSDLGPDVTIANRATIWDPEDSTPANNTDMVLTGRLKVYLPVCLRGHTPTCVEGIANGGFEHDGVWEITHTPYPADYTTSTAHGGNRSIRLGVPQDSSDWPSWSSVYQEITIPPDTDRASLTFWYEPYAEGLWGDDVQLVSLLDGPPPATQLETILRDHSDSGTWTKHQFDMLAYAGRTVYLYFTVYNDGDGARTRMYVDDVSLELCSPTSPLQ